MMPAPDEGTEACTPKNLVEDHATAEEKQNAIPGTEATIHTVDIDNEGDEREMNVPFQSGKGTKAVSDTPDDMDDKFDVAEEDARAKTEAEAASDHQNEDDEKEQHGQVRHLPPRKKLSLAKRLKLFFSLPKTEANDRASVASWKKNPARFFFRKRKMVPEERRVEEEEEDCKLEVSLKLASRLPPNRIAHTAMTLAYRERDVKAELLQVLVKEHAHLRTNLSMGLAGLHEISCLVAQEEARQIWLKEAIVVEREAFAAIAVLEGLNLRIHERCHYLDGNMDRGTSFLLHAQTIAKCTARADILDQVHALLPDVPAGRLELPDLHSMFMLLRAWEKNQEGFEPTVGTTDDIPHSGIVATAEVVDAAALSAVTGDGSIGGSFQNPVEMIQRAGKMLEEVLLARGKGPKNMLLEQLKNCSSFLLEDHEPKKELTLDVLADQIEVIDGTLENLHDEQHHLEDYLDRALDSQVHMIHHPLPVNSHLTPFGPSFAHLTVPVQEVMGRAVARVQQSVTRSRLPFSNFGHASPRCTRDLIPFCPYFEFFCNRGNTASFWWASHTRTKCSRWSLTGCTSSALRSKIASSTLRI